MQFASQWRSACAGFTVAGQGRESAASLADTPHLEEAVNAGIAEGAPVARLAGGIPGQGPIVAGLPLAIGLMQAAEGLGRCIDRPPVARQGLQGVDLASCPPRAE